MTTNLKAATPIFMLLVEISLIAYNKPKLSANCKKGLGIKVATSAHYRNVGTPMRRDSYLEVKSTCDKQSRVADTWQTIILILYPGHFPGKKS